MTIGKSGYGGLSEYLEESSRIPLLTPEEELLLARQIQKYMELKDKENPSLKERKIIKIGLRAYQRFVAANTKLVVTVAKKYINRIGNGGMDFMDLVQEGNVGLSTAVLRFDPERGYKFSTYAYWWIRQGITRAIEHQERPIRVPANGCNALLKLSRWIPEYAAEHGKNPTIKEMSAYTGIKAQTLSAYLEHSQSVFSLDYIMNPRGGSIGSMGEPGRPLIEEITEEEESEEDLFLNHARSSLDDWLMQLSERERLVILMRFSIGTDQPASTCEDVARILKCSSSRIQQIQETAWRKLRLISRNEFTYHPEMIDWTKEQFDWWAKDRFGLPYGEVGRRVRWTRGDEFEGRVVKWLFHRPVISGSNSRGKNFSRLAFDRSDYLILR